MRIENNIKGFLLLPVFCTILSGCKCDDCACFCPTYFYDFEIGFKVEKSNADAFQSEKDSLFLKYISSVNNDTSLLFSKKDKTGFSSDTLLTFELHIHTFDTLKSILIASKSSEYHKKIDIINSSEKSYINKCPNCCDKSAPCERLKALEVEIGGKTYKLEDFPVAVHYP